MLTVHDLSKTFSSGMVARRRTEALRGVNLHIEAGESVGLFGPSGSGKTTLANLIAGVLKPTAGEIRFHDQPIQMPYRGAVRRAIQVLYQHPESAFDPGWSLKRSILEPLRVHKIPYTEEHLCALLAQVGLYDEHLTRGLHALSGGELQRAALARVMVLEPELILLDEPTSMLDSISQAQVLGILKRYQREHGTAYLLISHDAQVIRSMCSRCYTIDQGELIREERFEDA